MRIPNRAKEREFAIRRFIHKVFDWWREQTPAKPEKPARLQRRRLTEPTFDSYPPPLGRKEIISIELTEEGRKWLIAFPHLTYFISEQLRNLNRMVYMYGSKMINKYVPADVGYSSYQDVRPNLRKSLRESLVSVTNKVPRPGNNTIEDVRLSISMFSNLPYSGIVNEMSTSKVRHFGNKISKKTKEPLYDPQAVGGFYDVLQSRMKTYVRTVASPFFLRAVLNLMRRINRNFLYANVRKMFKIRYTGRGAFTRIWPMI